jgi:ADP-ribose pyrophosphatase YjhB (NUDIX family)
MWGERLQDAVVRETREETGVTVAPREVLLVLDLIEGAEGDGGHHFVVVDYLCEYVAGEVRAGSDAEAAAWVARDDLGGYDLTESMLAVVTEAFRRTPQEERP